MPLLLTKKRHGASRRSSWQRSIRIMRMKKLRHWIVIFCPAPHHWRKTHRRFACYSHFHPDSVCRSRGSRWSKHDAEYSEAVQVENSFRYSQIERLAALTA